MAVGSFSAGLSGLNANAVYLSVIGNNLANINTIGFKSSAVTFMDLVSQTVGGAAANPNMGYHSSPLVSLLMTMLNVRLGWWLGNPGEAGENTWKRNGPPRAAFPIIMEAFGLTNENRPYVNLSDGGHFENLGLYEMVRRRCLGRQP